MSREKTPPKAESDPFRALKHIGYHMSQPPGKLTDATLGDFVRFARYQISQAKRILFYDPVLETYTDEQILTEYFALQFDADKEYREKFEAEVGIADESDLEWMDRQIAENQKTLEKAAPAPKEEPPEFEDTPESLLKDEEDGLLD